MAAAAAVSRRTRVSSKESVHPVNLSEPVSFHLAFLLGNQFVLPEGKNSVDVLRMPFNGPVPDDELPESTLNSRKFSTYFDSNLFLNKPSNLTGTKMEFWTKKYNSTHSTSDDTEKVWQDRLLIVTDKRIFVITLKTKNDDKQATGWSAGSSFAEQASTHIEQANRGLCKADLEIVDSIPVEEITYIRLESKHGGWDDDEELAPRVSHLSSCLRGVSALLGQASAQDCPDPSPGSPSSSANCLSQASYRHPAPVALDGQREPILRITTKPGGFNNGRTYYFLLRQQDHHCLEAPATAAGDGGGAARRPLRDRADAEALAARLGALAARRRGEHSRETRFLRLQV
jgi:hypothetical protein